MAPGGESEMSLLQNALATTEFRRGLDEATNRTHEMLRNLQESLKSVKIKIKL
jgi:hypothetical protein